MLPVIKPAPPRSFAAPFGKRPLKLSAASCQRLSEQQNSVFVALQATHWQQVTFQPSQHWSLCSAHLRGHSRGLAYHDFK